MFWMRVMSRRRSTSTRCLTNLRGLMMCVTKCADWSSQTRKSPVRQRRKTGEFGAHHFQFFAITLVSLCQVISVGSQSMTYVQLQTLQLKQPTELDSQNCSLNSSKQEVTVRTTLYHNSLLVRESQCETATMTNEVPCSEHENQTTILLNSLPLIVVSKVSVPSCQNHTLCFSFTLPPKHSLRTFCMSTLHPPDRVLLYDQTLVNVSNAHEAKLALTLRRNISDSDPSFEVMLNLSNQGCCPYSSKTTENATHPVDNMSDQKTEILAACLGVLGCVVFVLVAAWLLYRFWWKFIEEGKRRAKAQSVLRKASQHFELRTLQLQTFGYVSTPVNSPTEGACPDFNLDEQARPAEVDNASLIPPLLDADLLHDFQRQDSFNTLSRGATPQSPSHDEVDGNSECSSKGTVQTNEIALIFEEGPGPDSLSLHETIVI